MATESTSSPSSQADTVEAVAFQDEDVKPLSKKGQKKAAKAARMAELKLERRAREKEAKKRKRQERAQAEQERKATGAINAEEPQRDTKRRRVAEITQSAFGAQIAIDLGFDDLMLEKEIISLTSQLAYTYSANRHAPQPFSKLLFTSLNKRTKNRLDGINNASYTRWTNTEWREDDYERLWADNGTSSDNSDKCVSTQANVIYLTADSEEELLELREGETYVIGGICDHNRYKNLCLNKAIASGVRHARLPIGRYMASLTTRKVLTVNQVFEILLKWVESRDWEKAFWGVIPKRKFQISDTNYRSGNTETIDHTQNEDDDEPESTPRDGDTGSTIPDLHSQSLESEYPVDPLEATAFDGKQA
ncbi:guanine-1-methyltransferase-domain-containing protein [Hygrophoropsis aurantiaca]|uniref:Guanine-1-methyltransferase-domain-containing protein n=1 Tax=Hygrophoropsis aurantiaca TaxID=72124 RepID=A0ACB8A8X2_9AGAM|nr:guanine-1-methyltransferase-domain-containing protein [Hygrophoropsis aurantiaca]